MNAHINRDLPVALSQLAGERGGYPAPGSPQFRDYQTVNQILASVEAQVRDEFLAGIAVSPGLSDVLAMWKVATARDVAWSNGGVLWHLRDLPALEQDYLGGLDRTVGFAGRGLLLRA